MTPSARIATAISLLDTIVGGEAAERALTRWARASRYAGSRDRAAVRDIVFDCLRRRRSFLWLSGQAEESGRALVLGYAVAEGLTLTDAFDGIAHGALPVSTEEHDLLRSDISQAPQAVCYDYPDFLQSELERSLGAGLVASMTALQSRASVDLRVNLLRADPETAQKALLAEEVMTDRVDPLETALRVTKNPRRVAPSQAYRDGLVELQDAASQEVARLAGAEPGMTVLDYCAGGGGKTLAMAATMQGQGRLLAHDVRPARMKDLPARAGRAGATISIRHSEDLGDLTSGCDLVLVDAPCSGTGAWRRNPDAKWRLTDARLRALSQLQGEILDTALPFVRPGGRLVYATCSILQCENADVTRAFLERHPEHRLAQEHRLPVAAAGDGFYLAEIIVS